MTHQFGGGLPPHFWRLHFCKCLLWWKILNRLNSWFLHVSFLGVNSVLLYTLLWKDLFATQRLPKHKAHENGGWCGICMFLLLNQKRTSIFESAKIKAMGTNQGLLSLTNKHPRFLPGPTVPMAAVGYGVALFSKPPSITSWRLSAIRFRCFFRSDHVICSSRL